MKAIQFPRILPGFLGLAALFSTSFLSAGTQTPIPGNLTVTVQELEDGNVQISLSGTAYVQSSSFNAEPEEVEYGWTNTNYSPNPLTPPSYLSGQSFPVPVGLTLTAPERMPAAQSEGPEEGAPPIVANVTAVDFIKGNWSLAHDPIPYLEIGDPIDGAGSVVASIPFYHFIPGTFLVGPPEFTEDSEPEVQEGGSEAAPGLLPYFITYEVIPFVAAPAIEVSAPHRFPSTRIRRSGGSQKLQITNRGNTTLGKLAVEITGAAAGDFSDSPLAKSELAPGESTQITVDFRPRRRGLRRALLTAMGTAEVKQQNFTAEPESGVQEGISEPVPVPVPVVVSDSVELVGKGTVAKKKPRPKPRKTKVNTPRFPRYFLGH